MVLVEEKPIVPEEKLINLSTTASSKVISSDSKPSPAQPPEAAVRCSVIQRTPSTKPQSTLVPARPNPKCPPGPQRKEDDPTDVKVPLSMLAAHLEPEQEHPIDYHIPKQRTDEFDEREAEKKSREARRSSAIVVSRCTFMRSLPSLPILKSMDLGNWLGILVQNSLNLKLPRSNIY